MAKKIKTVTAAPTINLADARMIRVNFGDLLFRPDANYGRYISRTGDEPNLKKLKESLANHGMIDGEIVDVVPAFDSNIEAEIQTRERMLKKAREAAKGKESSTPEACYLDVLEYYFTNGKPSGTPDYAIRKPQWWQCTGNQRGSQYLAAMALRLHRVRKNGYEKWGFTPIVGVAAANVPASEICQQEYTVRSHDVMSLDEIMVLQSIENGEQNVGNTKPTAVDFAYTAFQLCKSAGKLIDEATMTRRLKISRGVGQHVQLICRVQWELGDLHDVFAAAMAPSDGPALHITPEGKTAGYQNPLVWATSSVNKNNPIHLRVMLARLNDITLSALNREYDSKGQEHAKPATAADLLQWLIKCPIDKPEVKSMTWEAAETAAAEYGSLFVQFVAACRSTSLTEWESKHHRTIRLIKKVMADSVFGEKLFALLPTAAETADETDDETADETADVSNELD